MGFLPSGDRRYLTERKIKFEEVIDGTQHGLVLPARPIPPSGLDQQCADLLILIPNGYADVPPDMFYLNPWLRMASTGQFPRMANVPFQFNGVNWQRWSRHNNEWRRGVDGIWTMLKRIEHALREAT